VQYLFDNCLGCGQEPVILGQQLLGVSYWVREGNEYSGANWREHNRFGR
jgi:hypothetical protein